MKISGLNKGLLKKHHMLHLKENEIKGKEKSISL